MKRSIVLTLMFVVVLCSLTYAGTNLLDRIKRDRELDVHFREYTFRHDEYSKYNDYEIKITDYRDEQLKEYGY